MQKSAFKKPDKVPYTYDGKSFELDGRMDLDISFDGHTMTTPVYLKMDAKDSLLLSEGVCRQLKIISLHSNVDGHGEQQSKRKGEQLAAIPKEDEESDYDDVVRLKAVAASDVTNRKRKLGELLAEAGPGRRETSSALCF